MSKMSIAEKARMRALTEHQEETYSVIYNLLRTFAKLGLFSPGVAPKPRAEFNKGVLRLAALSYENLH